MRGFCPYYMVAVTRFSVNLPYLRVHFVTAQASNSAFQGHHLDSKSERYSHYYTPNELNPNDLNYQYNRNRRTCTTSLKTLFR